MKRIIALACALCVFATVGQAGKHKPGTISYVDHTLKNGLRVVISQDHSVPVVAVNIWYHVGSANEVRGRSGFAHLFEHMMFQGSANVGKSQHFQYISRAGGTMNGSTTQDRTNYFEVLPANRLNLGLWLESDRMRSLAITKKNLENQRQTVKEERRQRVDNQPYGKAFLVSDTLGFDSWPYAHTTIGRMADLDAARLSDVKAFFKRYYCPANAVLAIVGDVRPAHALDLVRKYFGDIPAGTPSAPVVYNESFDKGQRREVVDSPKANVPAVFISYLIPPASSPDTPALTLLSDILTTGDSSRLHKRLVKDEKAAFGVFGFIDSRVGPSLFRIIVVANAGVAVDSCEQMAYEEIDRVKNKGISDEELEKARVSFETKFIENRQTVLRKAEAIQRYIRFDNDLSRINTSLDSYLAVTAADIQRVARKYLTKNNRTVVVAQPPSS